MAYLPHIQSRYAIPRNSVPENDIDVAHISARASVYRNVFLLESLGVSHSKPSAIKTYVHSSQCHVRPNTAVLCQLNQTQGC